jgi:hypothetical protein
MSRRAPRCFRTGKRERLAVERLEARRLLSVVPIGTEFRANTFTFGHQEQLPWR